MPGLHICLPPFCKGGLRGVAFARLGHMLAAGNGPPYLAPPLPEAVNGGGLHSARQTPLGKRGRKRDKRNALRLALQHGGRPGGGVDVPGKIVADGEMLLAVVGVFQHVVQPDARMLSRVEPV